MLTACGKTSDPAEGNQSGGGSSGASGAASGATSAVGGGGASGASGKAPIGGAGGDGPASILAPLDTDDATLEGASGAELIELALQIGYAHGYALCTCVTTEPLPPSSLPSCARAESGFSELLFEPAGVRCLVERAKTIPGVDEALRCRARILRAYGKNFAVCPEGPATRGVGVDVESCPPDAATAELFGGGTCYKAFSCADDTLLLDGHCDLKRDCEDGEDERDCGELQCGDELVDRLDACEPDGCGLHFDPPLCSPGGSSVLCGDGNEISIHQLCNGMQDCANGRDEAYCF